MNFLIDENVLTGKGANSTISYVHYFFGRHGLGETEAQIHADNCSSQNKNSAFLWYYMWHVTTGLHEEINYNFVVLLCLSFSCLDHSSQASSLEEWSQRSKKSFPETAVSR